MIPYSYNMVDMGGIDLAEANGTVVHGVYEKIVEAMNLCGDLILYNWKFAGINIAPSAYSVLQQAHSILINGMIQVAELDQITVIGLPPPIVPVSPLEATENGVYEAEPPASGFNPVRVTVPERIPVVEQLDVDTNGVYNAPTGVDGFNPVRVSIPSGSPQFMIPHFQYDHSLNFGWSSIRQNGVPLNIGCQDLAVVQAYATTWNAASAAYYLSENLIGAYFGVTYDYPIVGINHIDFVLGRYQSQNKTLILTIEYFNGEEWVEIQDIEIGTAFPYPYSTISVPAPETTFYGIRGIHKKEPVKTSGNNIIFFGMVFQSTEI